MQSRSFLLLYAVTLAITVIGLIPPCECMHHKDVTKDDPILLAQAKDLLSKLNSKYEKWSHKKAIDAWDSYYNPDQRNTSLKSDGLSEVHKHRAESRARIAVETITHDDVENDATYVKNTYHMIKAFPWRSIVDYDVRRQFEKYFKVFTMHSSKLKYHKHANIIRKMENVYATTKICNFTMPTQCNLALQPEITEIMMKSRNPEELKYIWESWHDATGTMVKNYYIDYVKLSNKIAHMNNHRDMSAMWLSDYETDNFMAIIDSLWNEVKPLYKQLHAYVRRQLRHKYGHDVVSKKGPLPAHLLGNMWAQSWVHIAELSMPYPKKKLPDVTQTMIEQKWTRKKIFTTAESFFTSLKLSPMPELFWRHSILKKPKNRDIMCHPAAWDFFDGKNFRIIQCTSINMENLLTAYHEMGHIEYYIQYKDQPGIYKRGANSGFHEAVGDTILLSASTPNNFHKIGLLNHTTVDTETIINHLYISALQAIVILPFAYTMEKWRYDIFQSKVTPDNYNCHWWHLNDKYRGIAPPMKRSKSSFDPGAKYHIIADVEYLRYFISYITQFQFHKALCNEAGKYDSKNPQRKLLSECNIRGSKKAGKLLRSMLKMGSSRPWQDAMEKITGQRNIDAGALMEYFMPLKQWLESENAKHDEFIGWERNREYCTENN